jgi:amino acid transporter
MDMQSFLGIITLIISTLINIAGTRILAFINNIGVVAEILGMLVFALILLFFFNHQPISVVMDTSFTTDLAGGSFPAVFLVGALMALFVVYGFDTAGTFGEETVDAARRAPRGLLAAIWISGIIGAIFLLAVTLSFQDMNAAITEAQASASRSLPPSSRT